MCSRMPGVSFCCKDRIFVERTSDVVAILKNGQLKLGYFMRDSGGLEKT